MFKSVKLSQYSPCISDVTRWAEALRVVSSNGGGIPAKRVSRLASFRGGAKNDDCPTVPRECFVKWLRCRPEVQQRYKPFQASFKMWVVG